MDWLPEKSGVEWVVKRFVFFLTFSIFSSTAWAETGWYFRLGDGLEQQVRIGIVNDTDREHSYQLSQNNPVVLRDTTRFVVEAKSRRLVPITLSSKFLAPRDHKGSLAVICTNCSSSWHKKDKVLYEVTVTRLGESSLPELAREGPGFFVHIEPPPGLFPVEEVPVRSREELISLPRGQWSKAFQLLMPEDQVTFWKDKLDHASTTGHLESEQLDFLEVVKDYLDQDQLETLDGLDELADIAVGLFGQVGAGRMFSTIGDFSPAAVIASPPEEDVEDCSCNRSSIFSCDFLGPSTLDCDKVTCDTSPDGCGFLWRAKCDGVCQGPQPSGNFTFDFAIAPSIGLLDPVRGDDDDSAGSESVVGVFGTFGCSTCPFRVAAGFSRMGGDGVIFGNDGVMLERGPTNFFSFGVEYPFAEGFRFRPYLGIGALFAEREWTLVSEGREARSVTSSRLGFYLNTGLQFAVSSRSAIGIEVQAAWSDDWEIFGGQFRERFDHRQYRLFFSRQIAFW